MSFEAPFMGDKVVESSVFVPTPWWLSGDISASDALAAYQGVSAASKAASLVNLAIPGTHNLTETGTVTWDAGEGWVNLDVNAYLKSTVVIPASDPLSGTAMAWWSNTSNNSCCVIGLGGTNLQFYHTTSDLRFKWGDNTTRTYTGTEWPGRGTEASATLSGGKYFLNGAYVNTIPAGVLQMGGNLQFGNSSAGRHITLRAMAFWKTNLTDAQVLAVDTAVKALKL